MNIPLPRRICIYYSAIFGLSALCLRPAAAAVVPPTDNTSAPYMGTYEWSVSGTDFYPRVRLLTSWLSRSQLWAETFAPSETWDGIQGPDWMMGPAQNWISQDPRRQYILSLPMLPGPISRTGPTSGIDAGIAVSFAQGANGTYNHHFQTLAQRLVDRGLANNTIIRLGWEFNGSWYAWCVTHSNSAVNSSGQKYDDRPENFAAYWRQIVTAMRSVPGAENLKFCWNGVAGWTGYPVGDAYPGDAYVDYVGVDAYDQSWAANTYPYPAGATPAQILTRQQNAWNDVAGTNNNGLAWWRDFAASRGKPLSIPEWGLCNRSDTHGGLDNTYYIQKMYDFIHETANNVAFHVYFNVQASDGHHQITNYNGSTTEFPNAAALFQSLFSFFPWTDNAIGAASGGTTATINGGDLSIEGAGAGYNVYATSDNFRYFAKPLLEDGDMVVNITGMASTSNAQTGLMIREGLGANARYSSVFLMNGTGIFQSRPAPGAAAVRDITVSGLSAPKWLLLRKQGAKITSFYSTDGMAWTFLGSRTMALGANLYIGVATSGGSVSAINATTITHFDQPISLSIDNNTAGAVTTTGSWNSSSTTMGYEGSNYSHDNNTGKGAKSITYTPNMPGAGTYAVYLNWPADPNRASNVPVTVTYSGGSTTFQIDQRTGGHWVPLGSFPFAAGAVGTVTIGTTGTTGYVTADAVRFVATAPETILVDNSDTSEIAKTGTWLTSNSTAGYWGLDYLHDNNEGKGTKSVLFTPTLYSSGLYKVYMNWTSFSNRATNVPMQITTATGPQNITVNQTLNGNWALLGTYSFDAHLPVGIQVSNTNTNGYVVVDGIRLEAVSVTPDP